MDKITAGKIIGVLKGDKNQKEGFKADFDAKKYTSYFVSKENLNYFSISSSLSSNKKILFVDGGNAEIYSDATSTLQLVRLYATIFKNNKRILGQKIEFFALAKIISDNNQSNNSQTANSIGGAVKLNLFQAGKTQVPDYLLGFDGAIFSNDSRLYNGGILQPSRAIDIFRRIGEINLAKKILIEDLHPLSSNNSNKIEIIVLDGSLETGNLYDETSLRDIIETCEKSKVALCAVSKTSKIMTLDGNSIINEFLNLEEKTSNTKEDSKKDTKIETYGMYSKLADCNLSKAPHFSVFILKLHPKSKFAFRIDVSNNFGKNDIELELISLFSALCNNSTDATFLGYPYGLVHADKFARVSNWEREYYKTLFMTRAGKDWKILEKQASSITAHSILDNI